MRKNTHIAGFAAVVCIISILFLTVLMVLSIPTWASVSAPTDNQRGLELWNRTTAASDAENIITLTSDSVLAPDYFGARFIKDVTSAEPFGSWDSTDLPLLDNPGSFLVSRRINADDYSERGNLGIWYRNVGNYQGHPIDLKATIVDYDFYKDLDGNSSNMIFFVNKQRIGFSFIGQAWISIRYDYYNADTQEPVSMKNYMTFDDIDYGQAISIIDHPGQLYVPDDSNLRVMSDSSGNTIFVSDSSWYDDSSSTAHHSVSADAFMTMFEGSSQTQVFYCGKYFRSNYFDSSNYIQTFQDEENLRTLFASRDYFGYTGQPLAATEPSTPTKEVTDSDESGTENTLSSISEEYLYSIYHIVPNENPENYYTAYEIDDELLPCIEFLSGSVFNINNEDVTEQFTITQEDQLIRFIAKKVDTSNFYYQTYRFDLNVKIKKDADLSNYLSRANDGTFFYTLPNTATAFIERSGAISKASNSVETYLQALHTNGSLIIHKSDSVTGKILKNAGFTLYEWNRTEEAYKKLAELTYDTDTDSYHFEPLTATILNQGKFKVVETVVPDTYEGKWEQEFELTKDNEALTYQVTNAPSGGNTITKTAVVISDGNMQQEESGTKDTPIQAKPGDIIEYHIYVTRKSTPGYKSDVFTIQDEIPQNAIWTQKTLAITGNITNPIDNSTAKITSMGQKDGMITWTAEQLDHNETLLLTYRVRVPRKETTLKNIAFLKIKGQEPIASNTTFHQVELARLSAEKSSNPASGSAVLKGSVIRYQIKITNTGKVSASNVIITDQIPDGTSFVAKSISCSASGASGSYSKEENAVYAILPVLESGAEETLSFKVTVNKDTTLGEIKNTARFKEAYTEAPENEIFNDEHFSDTNQVIHKINASSVTATPTTSGTNSAVTTKETTSQGKVTSAVKTGDTNHLLINLLITTIFGCISILLIYRTIHRHEK